MHISADCVLIGMFLMNYECSSLHIIVLWFFGGKVGWNEEARHEWIWRLLVLRERRYSRQSI